MLSSACKRRGICSSRGYRPDIGVGNPIHPPASQAASELGARATLSKAVGDPELVDGAKAQH